jgi:hypothetical protein
MSVFNFTIRLNLLTCIYCLKNRILIKWQLSFVFKDFNIDYRYAWDIHSWDMANKNMNSNIGYICTILITCVLLLLLLLLLSSSSYNFTAHKFPLTLLRSLIFILRGIMLKKKTRQRTRNVGATACAEWSGQLDSVYTVRLHGEKLLVKLMWMRHAKLITVLTMCRQYWVCFCAWPTGAGQRSARRSAVASFAACRECLTVDGWSPTIDRSDNLSSAHKNSLDIRVGTYRSSRTANTIVRQWTGEIESRAEWL